MKTTRTKAVYNCHYDGNQCEYAVPKFDENGYLIPESNEQLENNYSNVYSQQTIDRSWDKCLRCPRNYSIDGCCYGRLEIIECEV